MRNNTNDCTHELMAIFEKSIGKIAGMNDETNLLDFPVQILAGNEQMDFDPPAYSRPMYSFDGERPWYDPPTPDTVSIGYCWPNGKEWRPSWWQLAILWTIIFIISTPVALLALIFRCGDRILRWTHILQPLGYMSSCTPVEIANNALIFMAIRFGEDSRRRTQRPGIAGTCAPERPMHSQTCARRHEA